MGLDVVAFVAGIVAGLSPCVLPVLPVVLAAGATGQASSAPGGASAGRGRSLAVIIGLVVSFSVFTLLGSALLSALGLPQDLLRDLGIAVLAAVGLGLIIPRVGDLVERPFARIPVARLPKGLSGLVLGLGLGVVFVPCAGPVLAAISVMAATHRVGAESFVVTVLFAIGAALPLLVIALAGGQLASRARALRERAAVVRTVGGAILVAMAVVIALGATNGLAAAVPGYTNALQQAVEGSSGVQRQLDALDGEHPATDGSLGSCAADSGELAMCGAAPNFVGITAWLNTPGGAPLTMAELRGKVVLVDFWTYSCINCERALPHVEAWYNRYHADGFEVVGVHTPEFAFEHVVSNVRAAARQLGVDYPIAIDDNYDTWNAYSNEYWPADYLIDANGVIRAVSYGEGGYTQMEDLIRTLLVAAHPGLKLPPPTDVPNLTPTEETTPESYLGYERGQSVLQPIADGRAERYTMPTGPIVPNGIGLGGVWTVNSEEMTAGADARMLFNFTAEDVYLVTGGHGTIRVSLDNGPSRVVHVSGIPRLYVLVHGSVVRTATLHLAMSPGVQAYDFTFG
jgi:cytochrome c biogenesis protein CcdA/thiol-disulfide isomerase/thioredoxin